MTFSAAEQGRPAPGGAAGALSAEELLALARDCGADDCGMVSIDNEALATERAHVARAFPATRTLLSIVGRMHREPVRSPARSVANLEFHREGHEIDAIAARIVRRLEDRGIRALNPAMAFPMEMEKFPERGWIVSHKRVAEAAGLGRIGIHRSLIHPKFGSFVLLGTVLIADDIDTAASKPLDFNPCVECKLCVAACPVGAIRPDGYFNFSACLTHNYQQFMGGFANFVEDIAGSRSVRDFRSKVSYAETVTRWQSLSYGPNYNAAYCIAVCPAGDDVIGPYRADKGAHKQTVLAPLTQKSETVYVSKGSDAADHVARRFPHKSIRWVRPAGRATSRLPVRHVAQFPAGQGRRPRRGVSFHVHGRAGGEGDGDHQGRASPGSPGSSGQGGPRSHRRQRNVAAVPQQGSVDLPLPRDPRGPAEGIAAAAAGVREMLSVLTVRH